MCGEERGYFPYFYRFHCKQPGCPQCRIRYRRRCIANAQKAFAHASNSDCAFFTIILAPADSAQDACDEFDRARQRIRNAGHKHKHGWRNLKIMGFLEMDALDAQSIPLIGSQRSKLLMDMGLRSNCNEGPTWLPTIHGLVALSEITHHEFRDHLSERWSHTLQTHVTPFHADKPINDNIVNTITYSTKHQCGINIRGNFDPWPANWVAEYYSTLYESSKGFRGCTYTRGIERIKKANSKSDPRSNSDIYCEEPLPTLIDTFNYKYTM